MAIKYLHERGYLKSSSKIASEMRESKDELKKKMEEKVEEAKERMGKKENWAEIKKIPQLEKPYLKIYILPHDLQKSEETSHQHGLIQAELYLLLRLEQMHNELQNLLWLMALVFHLE